MRPRRMKSCWLDLRAWTVRPAKTPLISEILERVDRAEQFVSSPDFVLCAENSRRQVHNVIRQVWPRDVLWPSWARLTASSLEWRREKIIFTFERTTFRFSRISNAVVLIAMFVLIIGTYFRCQFRENKSVRPPAPAANECIRAYAAQGHTFPRLECTPPPSVSCSCDLPVISRNRLVSVIGRSTVTPLDVSTDTTTDTYRARIPMFLWLWWLWGLYQIFGDWLLFTSLAHTWSLFH